MTNGMRLFPLFAAVAAFILSSCDRHEWETKDGEPGVKELYTHHGDDHAEHGDDHGGHGKDGEHKDDHAHEGGDKGHKEEGSH